AVLVVGVDVSGVVKCVAELSASGVVDCCELGGSALITDPEAAVAEHGGWALGPVFHQLFDGTQHREGLSGRGARDTLHRVLSSFEDWRVDEDLREQGART